MPLIDVLLVLSPGEVLRGELAQKLADTVASSLNAQPGHVWVRLESLSSAQYAENHTSASPAELPAFIRVLQAHPPTGTFAEAEILALTRAMAQVLEKPQESVHVEYAPPGAGRVAFGGRLVI